MKLHTLFILLALSCLLLGCVADPRPRPYGFPRMELPAHKYQTFQNDGCPFTFDYPVYGQLEAERIDSCFFNIYFPRFGCRWHVTGRIFEPQKKIDYNHTYEDFRELVYKHTQKGSIYESRLRTEHGQGVMYELYGEVPTSAEFYFSDSTSYALTTSFYFDTAVRNDSLRPLIDYMKTDLQHMVSSLRWK